MTRQINAPSLSPVGAESAIKKGSWLVLLAAFLGWMFDGLEQAIFPLIANPALMQLTGNVKARADLWNGYITASWLLGAACGGLVFGFLGDRLGRIRAMSLSILMYSLFTGMGYFVTAPWQLAALRFVASLGMGGEWALGVALVMECWPERWRPILAGAIGASANVGYLLLGTFGYFFPVTAESWRWVLLAGLTPALLCLFVMFFVPESERWKQAVKHAEAHPFREIVGTALRRNAPSWPSSSHPSPSSAPGRLSSRSPSGSTRQLAPNNPSAKAVAQAASGIGAIIGCLIAPLIGAASAAAPPISSCASFL